MPAPPLVPCAGVVGGVFPLPPDLAPLDAVPSPPPPDPPGKPVRLPGVCPPPKPPPADVIVEKVELDPLVAAVQSRV